MRTGPLGRREAHISRFIEGSISGLVRPAFNDPVGRQSNANGSARMPRFRMPSPPSSSLGLKYSLPINLREFLAEEFAGGLQIDDDGVFTLGPEAGEDALTRVARAIRRYSTTRAHERWDECCVAIARLRDDLEWAAESGDQVALCLGCAMLEAGAGAVGRHRGHGCVAVDLSANTASHVDEPEGLPGVLLRVIEGFRLGRAALGLPHYDLDCYIARDQVIFTWRPIAG